MRILKKRGYKMASESGRPNEFADDAHFWPEDPIVEQQLLWMASAPKNDRIQAVSATDKYMTYIIGFNGKQIQVPVKIRKEND